MKNDQQEHHGIGDTLKLPSPPSMQQMEQTKEQARKQAKTFWERMNKAAVPDGTFGAGEEAERTLECSRCCLISLYSVLALVFFCSMVTILLGRQEIVDHRMKFARLETPSVAVCPWLAGTAVQKIPGASYSIHAIKYSLSGKQHLANNTHRCVFDRVCECLDLRWHTLDDVANSYHGPTGVESTQMQNYRERIEIHTNLKDPSPARTLKIGLYDSIDPRPSWFYGEMWGNLIGQLRLDSWLITESSYANLKAVVTGDMTHLERRHYYTYSFSATKPVWSFDEDHHRYTKLSYEFRNFFVLETITASSSWSLFTLFSLVVLVIALMNILMIWELIFPIYVEGSGEVQKRRVSPVLRWLSRQCCCGDLVHGHFEHGRFVSNPPSPELTPYGTV
eukprot:gnl/MRDRNA2_/MRDRNA2_88438_c0_seq1.p1 gnl/MRDRNA2_/MRDRNA2_88438_c0~~gnl/MRDRNA2_/MRDRNA2_88438_c0_seq1.p1  ORF type:complete len:392 (+),score=56.40 gnl/MRDRNA2_/MRDRNA2_88438_c0_seq1:97-1272(+)